MFYKNTDFIKISAIKKNDVVHNVYTLVQCQSFSTQTSFDGETSVNSVMFILYRQYFQMFLHIMLGSSLLCIDYFLDIFLGTHQNCVGMGSFYNFPSLTVKYFLKLHIYIKFGVNSYCSYKMPFLAAFHDKSR